MQFPDFAAMNVVMIYDVHKNAVLLQNRTKKWTGGCFPGGHLEVGESVYDSAVREVREETGLCVTDLVPCGLVHWTKKNGRTEFIFCYRTGNFSGELTQCDEGVNYWVDLDKLADEPLAPWFRDQLPLFFAEHYTEISHVYDHENEKFVIKWFGQGKVPYLSAGIPPLWDLPENR